MTSSTPEPDAELLRLGVAAVRDLVARRAVDPFAVSPLAWLLRENAAGAAEPAEVPDSHRPALDVLARPQAYVRVLVIHPDADEEVVGLLVRDGLAVSFSLADGILCLSSAQPLSPVAASLAASLTHEGGLAGAEMWLWPSSLQILTTLWQEIGDPARPLSRQGVIERLTTAEVSAAEAARLIAGAVDTGAVRLEREDELTIEESLRPWLSMLWSGHAVQVEYAVLAETDRLEEAIEGPRDHLLFVGPPGVRACNRVVTGEALAQRLGGRRSREGSLLHLRAMGHREAEAALRGLLQLDDPTE